METTIVTGARFGVRVARPAFVAALRPRLARAALRRRGLEPGTCGVTAPTTDPILDTTLVRTS
jgi:hypothetical protein